MAKLSPFDSDGQMKNPIVSDYHLERYWKKAGHEALVH